MPYKVCSKINCNKLISIDKRYCSKHEAEYEANKKDYIKSYDNDRKDSKEFNFYRTTEWILLRDIIKNKYKGICLYTYYKENKIVKSEVVHHIVELKEDYSKRLEVSNLIPLSESAHKKIHAIYKTGKQNKEKLKKELKELKNKFEKEFTE